MKLVLKIAHWTGGGVGPFLDMDCDEFIDWVYALADLQKEAAW